MSEFLSFMIIILLGIMTIVALELVLVCHCMIKIVAYLGQGKDDNDDGNDDVSTDYDPDPARNKYQFN